MTEDLGQKIHRTILGEPARINFTDKKGRIVKTFYVGLLSVKEVIQISRIVYGIDKKTEADISALHKLITEYSDKIISVIAIMLKSRSRLPLWYIKLIIRKYTTSADLLSLVNAVYEAMDVKSFLNSIILATGMSLIKKEEIIASKSDLEKKVSMRTRRKKEKA